uniref:ABC1 atypical kinase-like domain-containing protein n=1 Tax=Chlamydomonas leiostraca TaxID=1034604 RepID=A0A7S0RJH9_9CHLO|mmetsp:Transcript_23641/g.60397  ORF Transcript_23641/g.60397 Transcript_23641/m.60397 type:complete len:806 (+) Transcript_23641:93-2510(+)
MVAFLRGLALLSISVFTPLAWPFVKLSTLASHPRVEKHVPVVKKLLPARVRSVLAPFSWPLVSLMGIGAAMRTLTPDIARSVRVWRRILPIFSAYMWTKHSTDIARKLFHISSERVESRWAHRHEWGGRKVYDMVSQVRGYYVKSGQVLATKPEIIPQAWCRLLSKLWDDTTARPWKDVCKSIEADLAGTQLARALAGKDDEAARVEVVAGVGSRLQAVAGEPEGPSRTGPSANGAAKKAGLIRKDSELWSTVSVASDTNNSVAMSWAATKLGSLATWVGLGAASSARSDAMSTGTAAGRGSATPQGAFDAWLKSPSKGAGKGPVAQVAEDEDEEEHQQQELARKTSAAAPDLSAPAFTVSATASAVLAERAQTRPRPRRKPLGGLGSRLWRAGSGGGDGTATKREAGGGVRPFAKPGSLVARWFEWVDTIPLASASIAQVHAARLSPELQSLLGSSWAHGPDVVIKVQHHDVQALMGADLRNMGRIARFLDGHLPFDVMPAVQEMRTVIPKEFDFEREARLMEALRVRLARSSPRVVVPEPVMPLCGPGCLVMQRLHGTPLTALLAEAQKGNEAARQAAKRCLMPVLEAYGQMMLVGGLFHADPHPGNMLLQADGKVALLDYGQCKALGAEERRSLCALYLALYKADPRMVLGAAQPLGITFGTLAAAAGAAQGAGAGAGKAKAKPGPGLGAKGKEGEKVDPEACLRMMYLMFDTKGELQYNFGGGDVVEGAPLNSFPGALYLVCRAIMILRGLTAALKMDVSVVSMWRASAQAGLREGAAVAAARAAENAALDRGLSIKGVPN